MLDEETFLDGSHLIWQGYLLGLYTIERVPEADYVVDRSCHELVLLVDIESYHISSV